MSHYAIHAESLSKQYFIGTPQGYRTLREDLVRGIAAPFDRLWSGRERASRKETIWALKDISFKVAPGEVVGVIGRNGAGKSTLLKILSRITVPTEGQVAVRGRIASLLEIGTGFHPELTGRENIFLNGAILGMTRKEVQRKFDAILDFAGVERFVDTPVKHYSSGMYMRLAFAIAAHLESDILLVDEVLAVGDASFQQKCLAKMEDVAGHGRTVLFVSHNMTAVQSLCERVIYVENGQIRADGDPKNVIQDYLSLITVEQKRQKQLSVGDDLTITKILLSPNPVESGSEFRFEIVILANAPLQLTEAALLLYASEGHRVGIIDLRQVGLPVKIKTDESVRIEGLVRSLPLVENRYRVGLYLSSGAFVGDLPHIADLTVSPALTNSLYAPYRSDARGWVQFKTECWCQIGEPVAG